MLGGLNWGLAALQVAMLPLAWAMPLVASALRLGRREMRDRLPPRSGWRSLGRDGDARGEALLHLSRKGLAGMEAAALMDEAAKVVSRELGLEHVEVLELGPDGEKLLLRAGVGWRDGLAGRATVDATVRHLAGYTLTAAEPVVVHDLSREKRFAGHRWLLEHRVGSGISIPIGGPGGPLGVLAAYSTRARSFTTEELMFMGAVSGLLAAAMERRRVEDVLRTSEQRCRSLYRAVSGGVVVHDRDGTIVDANQVACEILGLSLDRLKGRTPLDTRWRAVREDGSAFPGEEHPAMVTLRTGQPVQGVVMGLRGLEGSGTRWILVNSQPVFDGAGEIPSEVVATFLDITERVRARDGHAFLAEAGAVLASSLDYETTLTAVAHLAVPRVADWCTVDVICASGSLRRVAMAHADGSKIELVERLKRDYPDDLRTIGGLAGVLNSGQSELYPEVSDSLLGSIAREDGHLEMLRGLGIDSVMVVPLVARGRILGAMQFVSAGSGRRFGSADLKLAEDLAHLAALSVDNARLYRDAQKAVEGRDEFLSRAAHELRTPMTSLLGFTQLALRQLEKDRALDTAQARQSLEMIEHHSEKLSLLVNQLLDVSRLESGRLRLDRQYTDLVTLVKRIVESARVGADGHDFAVKLPPSLPAMVDPSMIERVMVNLLDNALRFSPNGSPVDVEMGMPDAHTVSVAVRDRGIGIPPEQRHRVFDRYYRVHPDGPLGGMGLGLYVSREVVLLHGGRISLESPPNGGTRVVVTLPTGLSPEPPFGG